MLTLIWREMVDSAIYLIMAVVLSAIVVSVLLALTFVFVNVNDADSMAGIPVVLSIALIVAQFGYCLMGTGQMYSDRTGRISSFLSTLAVTRGQILLARVFVGLLAILIILVPVGIASVVVLRKQVPPFMFYSHFAVGVGTTAFLFAVASYCLGLQIGWRGRKDILAFGMLLLPAALLSLVVIKGFTVDTIIVLLLLIPALIVSVAMKFRSTPL